MSNLQEIFEHGAAIRRKDWPEENFIILHDHVGLIDQDQMPNNSLYEELVLNNGLEEVEDEWEIYEPEELKSTVELQIATLRQKVGEFEYFREILEEYLDEEE